MYGSDPRSYKPYLCTYDYNLFITSYIVNAFEKLLIEDIKGFYLGLLTRVIYLRMTVTECEEWHLAWEANYRNAEHGDQSINC